MSAVEKCRSPVYGQLEAYEETWKREHKHAMGCRDWEDAIAVGINIFRMLQEREQAWRELVFRGTATFSETDDLDHRTRFSNWLGTTKEVLAEVLPTLEIRFGVVDGGQALRQCAEGAEAILRDWQPPRLSRAVGLREMTLSPEAAAELDCVLAEAKINPPTMPLGPMPKEISSAGFFATLKRSPG